MEIAAYVRNLMFQDRILSAAAARGHTARGVGGPADLGAPDLLVVDLTEPGWEEVVAAARTAGGIKVLAFGPHIRSDLFAAARANGVDRAVANSKFAEDPAGLFEAAIRGSKLGEEP